MATFLCCVLLGSKSNSLCTFVTELCPWPSPAPADTVHFKCNAAPVLWEGRTLQRERTLQITPEVSVEGKVGALGGLTRSWGRGAPGLDSCRNSRAGEAAQQRRPGFSFQNWHGSLQPFITPATEARHSLLASVGIAYMWCTDIHADKHQHT